MAELDEAVVLTVDAVRPVVLADGGAPPARRLRGKVVDVAGKVDLRNRQVILWGKRGESELRPIVVETTDSMSNFSAPWPDVVLDSAVATVEGTQHVDPSHGVPIALDFRQNPGGDENGGTLPTFVYVVVVAEPAEGAEADCACEDQSTPRLPDQEDLVGNPGAYSQDIGLDCVNLTVPNRTLEEFSFTLAVRTSEPDIKGTTLSDLDERWIKIHELVQAVTPSLGQPVVRDVLTAEHAAGPLPADGLAVGGALLGRLAAGRPVRSLLGTEVAIDTEPLVTDLVLPDLKTVAGRGALTVANSVDWDSSATFYQATTIAHGHILTFKQVWKADGYSLGDLLYSLPLAPGQKKQVVIFDWDRTQYGTREESGHEDEALNAYLSHDRDINDITSGSFSESLRGGSKATTWGASTGGGAALSGTVGAFFIGATGGHSFGIGAGLVQRVAGREPEGVRTGTQPAPRPDPAGSVSGAQPAQHRRPGPARDRAVQGADRGRGQSQPLPRPDGRVLRGTPPLRDRAETRPGHRVPVHSLADGCLRRPEGAALDGHPPSHPRRPEPTPSRRLPSGGISLQHRPLADGFDAIERKSVNWVGTDFPDTTYADEQVGRPLRRPDDDVHPEPAQGQGRRRQQHRRPRLGGLRQLHAVDPPDALQPVLRRPVAAGPRRCVRARDRTEDRRRHGRPTARPCRHTGWAGDPAGDRHDPRLDVPARGATPGLRPPDRIGFQPASQRHCQAGADHGLRPQRHRLQQDHRPQRESALPHAATSRASSIRTPRSTTTCEASPCPGAGTSATDGVALPTPLSTEETRNLRNEDRELATRLVKHLNANLERYHRALWLTMDPDRRYMLLDGFLAPNAGGKSVASVVENRVIGIAGNSLIMPVAPGHKLDPSYEVRPLLNADGEPELDNDGNPLYEQVDLLDHYRPLTPPPPYRVSMPTRGVFAEAVMGACNSCEKKDETRFWRWEESPNPDEPTRDQRDLDRHARVARPNRADAHAAPDADGQHPNAPAAPEPGATLGGMFDLLGKAGVFKDVTGLDQNQKNALQALTTNVEAAKHYADKATEAGQARRQPARRRLDDRVDQEGGAGRHHFEGDRLAADRGRAPRQDHWQDIRRTEPDGREVEARRGCREGRRGGPRGQGDADPPDGTETTVEQKKAGEAVSIDLSKNTRGSPRLHPAQRRPDQHAGSGDHREPANPDSAEIGTGTSSFCPALVTASGSRRTPAGSRRASAPSSTSRATCSPPPAQPCQSRSLSHGHSSSRSTTSRRPSTRSSLGTRREPITARIQAVMSELLPGMNLRLFPDDTVELVADMYRVDVALLDTTSADPYPLAVERYRNVAGDARQESVNIGLGAFPGRPPAGSAYKALTDAFEGDSLSVSLAQVVH